MRAALLLAAGLLLAACEREERASSPETPPGEESELIALTTLSPGSSAPDVVPNEKGRKYERNAYHMNQGKRLFTWFNCTGCHGNGGGGSGPALMDDKWIYGADIENIVATIRQGRPNGMPSFRARIPDEQIWQIAAYVRSMGRYVAKDAAPGRSDDMNAGKAENRRPEGAPQPGGSPP
jgi:cytochrome c oxidase cbb3-type subunit III